MRETESKNDTRERKNFFANDNSLTSLSSLFEMKNLYFFYFFDSIRNKTLFSLRGSSRVLTKKNKRNIYKIYYNLLEVEFICFISFSCLQLGTEK